MNAIIKPRAAPGLELLSNVPIPKTGINDILVKIKKTSICGTDLHLDKWDAWAQKAMKPPVIIGHEWVGIIAEVGSNVKGFNVGERISGEGHIVCHHCKNCLACRYHMCSNTRGVGVERDGCFAEYLSIPASNAWHADPKISDDVMACFDPLGNAVHAALEYELIGKDVLITGAGPIGCMATGIAKKAGARSIVVTDISEYRLELAKKMGASCAVIDTVDNLKRVEKELEVDEGFDVGLEISGAPKAISNMIDLVSNGGKIALLGILPDGATIDWTKVIFKSLTLTGISGRKIFGSWYRATNLVTSGFDITPIITHKFHYKDFRKAFDLAHSGKCGKLVFEWS